MKILALDLGKFNTTCCFFETKTRKFPFLIAFTNRKYLATVFKNLKIDRVVREACRPSGWVSDLAEVLLRTSSRRARAIGHQLRALNQDIAGYDSAIQALVKQYADYRIVQSLPCGAKSQSRILAALGDDRARFGSAAEPAAASGIAPLTTQSGKQRFVSSRWACSKFIRQTLHEFAGLSVARSRWAKAFYDQQLASGKSSQVARRALAYKWTRIIYRCWQTRQPYDEQRYELRLQAAGWIPNAVRGQVTTEGYLMLLATL